MWIRKGASSPLRIHMQAWFFAWAKTRSPGENPWQVVETCQYAAGLRRLEVFVVRMMEQAGGSAGGRRDVAKKLLGMVDSSGAVAQVRAVVAAVAAVCSGAADDAAQDAFRAGYCGDAVRRRRRRV
jgi:hypothetical protein